MILLVGFVAALDAAEPVRWPLRPMPVSEFDGHMGMSNAAARATMTNDAQRGLGEVTPFATTKPLGIDVSVHNQTVNWPAVKSQGGKTFAFVRASAGKNTADSRFATNAAGALGAGLIVGTYHFAYPEYFTPQQEAQKFLSVAAAYVGEGYLPPALDIEDSDIVSEDSHPWRMGKAALSQWIREWSAAVEQATGVKPMIYTTRWYAQNYMASDLSQHLYWVPTDSGNPDANPGDMGVWSSWTFQQYDVGGGTCPGVSGAVDLNSFNGDLNDLMELIGTEVASPAVTLETRQVTPTTVAQNGTFSVNTTLRVSSGTAEHAGISISFPSLTTPGGGSSSYTSSQGEVATDFASSGATQWYLDGAVDPMTCADTSCDPDHLLAEADWSNVSAGSSRSFNLDVTPKATGSFKVRIRAWVTTNGYLNASRDPSSASAEDQQHFAVYEYTVNVTSASSCSLSVTSPNGGENWTVGESRSLGWQSNGSACGSSTRIDLLKSGSYHSTIASSTSNDGSFSWSLPSSLTPASDYTIRVTDTTNSSYTDTSNGSFTVSAPGTCTLNVTSPNGGESWPVGESRAITWSSTGNECGSNVRIELMEGSSVYDTLTESTLNHGSFNWTPDNTVPAGTNYRIRITDVTNGDVTDTSDSSFTISTVAGGNAVYDPLLKAPKCAAAVATCDSGTLLVGRGLLGPEPNAPNTVGNSCQDSSEGTFHQDESVDRIRISSQDGAALTAGRAVNVELTIFAYGAGDHFDIYYATDAVAPNWIYLATADITYGGEQTWGIGFQLGNGSLQVLRAQLRWQGEASICTSGTYDDRDDLVIAVQSPGISVTPTSGLVTTEAGGAAQFTVALQSQPTANVTIPLSSSDVTEGVVSPASLVFTSADWNTPRSVTVIGVDDATRDGNVAYSIVVGTTLSSDGTYSGIDPADVAVTNSDNDVLATPVVTAMFTGANVGASWSAVSGASSYELQRSYNAQAYTALYSGGALSYTDSSCPAATACLYRIRALDGVGPSPWHMDLATTIDFTDQILRSGTLIKALHVTQARSAVDAVRRSAGLAPASYTSSSLQGVVIMALHLTELRSALDAARSALGLPAWSYTTTISASARIYAADVTDIRNATK